MFNTTCSNSSDSFPWPELSKDGLPHFALVMSPYAILMSISQISNVADTTCKGRL